eukprot:scaffold74332_cov39-Phaeocystis_antarctica.AAC.1
MDLKKFQKSKHSKLAKLKNKFRDAQSTHISKVSKYSGPQNPRVPPCHGANWNSARYRFWALYETGPHSVIGPRKSPAVAPAWSSSRWTGF